MTRPNRLTAIWRRLLLAASLLLTIGLLAAPTADAGPRPSEHGTRHPATHPSSPKPTIVLVHGAFADASGFGDVIMNLQRQGYPVYAPANPLRGLASDADYLKTFLSTISGPIILVGHSYGGAVITNAATGNANVKALVYIAAYALDQGESPAQANELGGGPPPLLASHVVLRPFPGSGQSDADVTIDPAYFHAVFAADLPRRQTAVMAAAQRPIAYSSLAAPSGEPAWKSIPAYYLVAKQDNAIPPAAERAMAKRANAHTIEINSSHVAMTSHPTTVTRLILAAVYASR